MHDRFGFTVAGTLASVVPLLCGVVGAFVANLPISIFGGLLTPPLFAFMPVYFWCLVRPDLMPPWAALVLGVLNDLLSGGAMGAWAMAFVVAYALVDRERDSFAGLSGLGAVLGFAAAVLLASVTAFAVVALTYERFPPAAPLILMIGETIVLYLPVLWLLNLLHHKFVGPLRSDF